VGELIGSDNFIPHQVWKQCWYFMNNKL